MRHRQRRKDSIYIYLKEVVFQDEAGFNRLTSERPKESLQSIEGRKLLTQLYGCVIFLREVWCLLNINNGDSCQTTHRYAVTATHLDSLSYCLHMHHLTA